MAAPCPEVAHAVHCETLDDVTSASHTRVLQWRKERLQAQQLEAQRALGELRREKAALENTQMAVVQTSELAHQASALQAASERVQMSVEMSTQAAASRLAVGKEVRDRLLTAEKEAAQDLEVHLAKLHEEQAAADSKGDQISDFFSMYEDKLGLRIERVAPACVKVAFTLLDEEQPQREGSFKLGKSKDMMYAVSDCCPALPQGFLSKLVDRLNRNDDASALPAFCCSMRRAFKRAICKAGVAGGA
eukprot:TRINITY_DN77841_c0_g1_i1.p1 TRINITY_DN77841_c0_g1~~TRINITY_DN77841_c0_g1_i1.p1  ORF type:complete len:247 (-),score=77.48 TRINITY_DN77841_c0_g1_i1:195-935(-)